jgi:hypothetical protein
MLMQGEPDLRRHPRAKVNWPVTVEVDGEALQTETMNLSPFGAKLAHRHVAFTPGRWAHLRFHPGARESFDVQAIVWRIDPDGDAFFFTSSEEHLVASRAADQHA